MLAGANLEVPKRIQANRKRQKQSRPFKEETEQMLVKTREKVSKEVGQ